MLRMSLEARIYFFACSFLWDLLSFFHYLDEEIAEGQIRELYLKWSGPFEDLAHWALEEKFFPIEEGKITRNEEDLLLSTAETFLDTPIVLWSNGLNTEAVEMHKKYTNVSKPLWIYYYYCRFLKQVLSEFDGVLQELGNSSIYYGHYQQDISLFTDMAKALEKERPFLNTADVSEATRRAIWGEIDAYAAKLGAEWRQLVLSAARDLKLPDFNENAAN